MKKIQLSALLAIVLPAFVSADEIATIKDNTVNVRGQPNLVGEVVTQLKRGEKVTILEEITTEKPKPDEPAKWLRIKMPENTPVWVFAPLLNETNKTVNVSRLNLRAGPGENFSVVGRLDRGAPVKDIRKQGDWIEIETPPGAYAFLAAELVTRNAPEPAAAAPAELAKAEPVAKPVESKPAPVVPPKEEPKAPPAETPAKTNQTVALLPAVVPPPAAQPATNAVQSPPVEQPTKRIVTREGIVRSTFSIQAPTYFELVSPETRKPMNYLHSTEPSLKLKDFKGRKILVTGEEGIDSRWPNTPVIDVQSIELAP